MLDPSRPDDDRTAIPLPEDATRADMLDEDEDEDGLQSTEVDPYATAMPSATADYPDDLNPSSDQTEADPYSTRFTVAPAHLQGSVFAQGWTEADGSELTDRSRKASRYQPLRLHARGGLGEIYVAVDDELNREVALKEIQERHGGHLDSQYRFVFEAEITGGLEHPGIVPVYGLGRYADGRPYYAMRFIRGDSLKAAIKHFHDARQTNHPASPLAHSIEFRQLVARFVAVCQAIDYAHSRGILHRDIKPDNIMLGPYGETLVVDWGLAKAMNRPDPVEPHAPRPLRPLSGSDTSATMAGSVMGTPSFMSPEQASGEVETLGPTSDVFSLGSTLYALLTGHPPFRQKTIEALLEQVKVASFPAPRTENPAVPRALDAITRKAMARFPLDRYPSAAAFGADLERWLADEPVDAYPEPWTDRASRWARRHRTTVAVAFALILSAATALGIGTVLIGREQARTERNYQRARSSVEQMLDRVGEVELADIPQMETVRRDLLDRALGFYREFSLEKGGQGSTRLETARALVRLGDIRELLGQYVQAEKNYREALTYLDGNTNDLDTRRALARARTNLGLLLKKSNRFAESEAVLRRALTDRRALVAEHPDDPDARRGLATTVYQLGTLLARLANRSQEDEAAYREAIQAQTDLANQPANQASDRRDLARYLNNLGILQAGSNPDEAEKTFLQAMKLQDELQASSASNAGFRWQRARTWNNLANLYARAKLMPDAQAAFAQARAGFEALASDFAGVPEYRRELAITLNNLAQVVEIAPSGDLRPIDLLNRAMEEQRRLVLDFPEVPDHRMKLAVTLLHRGELRRSTLPIEAETDLLEAVAMQKTLVADYPQVPEYQAALGRTLTTQAQIRSAEGKPSGALDLLKPAIEALERARGGNPRDLTYVRFLFDARDDLARVLVKLGRHADLAREAIELAKLSPDRPEAPRAAAGFLARCFEIVGSDTTLEGATRRDLQETYARQALDFLRQAIDRGDRDPSILDAPDFQPLKARPEFEKLRQDWQAKGSKGVG